MRKQGALRAFLAVPVFLLLFTAGYLGTSVVTAQPAYAIGCSPCIGSIRGLKDAISDLGNSITAAVAIATAQIIAHVSTVMVTFVNDITGETAVVTVNLAGWLETFWDYNMLPAMQDVTEQVATVTQGVSSTLIHMTNADGQNKDQVEKQVKQVLAEQALRSEEGLAVVSTIVGGLSRADGFSEGYNTSAPVERAPRTGNKVGTPSAAGTGADMKDRWQNYLDRYCDKDINNGAAGCVDDAPQVGRDIDVGGTLFLRDTLEVGNTDTRKNIDDLITNLAEPFAKNPVAPGAVESTDGQASILAGEAYKAKRQVIYDSIYQIVGRRVPGSRIGAFLTPLRLEAGVKPSMISLNPSYNEVMQVMMNERFRTGKFANNQMGEPENNARELVVQQAFQMMNMSDQLDLMDRYSLLLAAQAGADIRKDKPGGTAAAGATLR